MIVAYLNNNYFLFTVVGITSILYWNNKETDLVTDFAQQFFQPKSDRTRSDSILFLKEEKSWSKDIIKL